MANKKEANVEAFGLFFGFILAIIGAVISYSITNSFIVAFLAFWVFLVLNSYLLGCLERSFKRSISSYGEHNTEKIRGSKAQTTPQKTNILQSENGLYGNKAYFDNGVVYQYLEGINEEIIIGKYDQDGKVYDEDGYEIARIDTNLDYGFVQLVRFGDMKKLRESLFHKSDEDSLTQKEKEHYYPSIKSWKFSWICAEATHYGVINAKKTSETIAKPLISYEIPSFPSAAKHQKYLQSWKDDSYILAFGACFACLAYRNGKSTKYGSFYCPIGETFEEPQ